MAVDWYNLSNDLKRMRKASGLLQSDVADKSGLTKCYVSLLESGRHRKPTWGSLVNIVHACGFQIYVPKYRIAVGHDVGDLLFKCRAERNWTQARVGSKIAVSGHHIYMTEAGTLPSWGVLVKLFQLYELEFEFTI